MPRKNPHIEDVEPTSPFHFPEIADIEEAVISLVGQLKESIENGIYDTIISDDIGGRIPTLILRRIITKLRPDIKPKTFFIASGKTYLLSQEDKDRKNNEVYARRYYFCESRCCTAC